MGRSPLQVGSELIQKYLGDGPKLVRELFRVADEQAPSIVFIGGSARVLHMAAGCMLSQRASLGHLASLTAAHGIPIVLALLQYRLAGAPPPFKPACVAPKLPP